MHGEIPLRKTINFFSVSVGREIIYLIFLGSLTYLRLDGDSPGTSHQSTQTKIANKPQHNEGNV